MGLANTVILSALTALVWRARTVPSPSARGILMLSSALAVVFINVKGLEYLHHDAAGHLPRVNTFLAMYFTLTGMHLAHVVAGFAANAWVVGGSRKVSAAMTAGRVRALAIYWLFVDLIWLVIFMLMYVS